MLPEVKADGTLLNICRSGIVIKGIFQSELTGPADKAVIGRSRPRLRKICPYYPATLIYFDIHDHFAFGIAVIAEPWLGLYLPA